MNFKLVLSGLITLLSGLLLIGCEKEAPVAPAPAPVPQTPYVQTPLAAFAHGKSYVEVGETINLINYSTYATHFEWDFGNGQTSTDKDPVISYSSAGVYYVRLTAFNDSGKTTSAQVKISVGNLYLVGFRIINFPPFNFGNPWDTNSHPDLYFEFGPRQGSPLAYRSPTVMDADAFPLTITLPSEIHLTNDDWEVILRDEDTPPDTDDSALSWMFNPVTDPNIFKDYPRGAGPAMIITPQGAQVEMLIELK